MEITDANIDNEGHAELEEWVHKGVAAIVGDTQCPGGRFQEVAVVQGGALVLAQWVRDAKSDWHCTAHIIMQEGSVPKLARLLRANGYEVMP
jgi:hypothetical protein